ncbi:MAG: methyl-accepting chemotaxis protein, partial [Enterobacterales bacterium]|nr:methyl-accepting chemotaxis protein [Enterobacterales bacterium]
MFLLVWGLFAIAVCVGWYYEHTSTAVIAGLILALSSTLIKMLFPGKLITRLFYAFTLLGFAALLIQLGEGETEFHFSVFVLLSALLAYRDYRPLLMGALTAAIHHLLFNYLQENDLYGIV